MNYLRVKKQPEANRHTLISELPDLTDEGREQWSCVYRSHPGDHER